MKKVALIADGWKRLITYAWIAGMKQYIETCDEQIEIYHYNCFGNWNDNKTFNQGEYNIYSLPDLKCFDGIVLDLTNVKDGEVLKETVSRVIESKVPAISLGHFEEQLYYVGMDNTLAIKELMNHLHFEHGCQTFHFVGGPKESSENQKRVESFLERIRTWGFDMEKNPVHYGTFEMNTGEEYFEQLIQQGRQLPEAFVCANDNIAAGLISKAQKYGYNVPGNFCVTGFDHLDKAVCFDPQITTVKHKREEMGALTIELFCRLWRGERVEKIHYLKPEISYTESCGCDFSIPIDYRRFVKKGIIASEGTRLFDEKRMKLEADLLAVREFEDVFRIAGDYFAHLDCDGITIVVDERLLNLESKEVLPVEGYEREHLMFVYDEDIKGKEEYRKFDDAWKEFQCNLNRDVIMFSPFHSEDRTFGFAILKNGGFLYDNPYYYEVQSLINRTIWGLYQSKCLQRANAQLDELYKRDALTGLYNRIAYYDMVEPMVKDCREKGIQCFIAFFDCDNFKQINDIQGHDAGDALLKEIGRTLKEFQGEHGYVYRFGGDEFVLVRICDSITDTETIEEKIQKCFSEKGISVSVGSCVTDDDNSKSLQDYVNIADQKMYANKRKKKVSPEL